ncbi:MAG TPA: hypothetical protein PL033_20545 [Candidatus Brocadiia bacterium]|nr:hypothetical protein [Candidatus Brocadiia bacterium]
MSASSLRFSLLVPFCLAGMGAVVADAHAAGKTIHVSKLGDNSDGSSWEKAFHTISAGLLAVPDDAGGYRVVVRPDTYMEANLYTEHRGAQGAYNELIGDFDGSLGSGAKGWVVIDSGDPEKGFKSYDWWGPVRAYSKGWSAEHTDETFSAICWDRWKLSRLYVTGGDGGLMFDCTDKVEPYTVIVEDCISIGRAFGGGVASCLSRYDEPIVFRRCQLWALDWWGDTAAAYVRVENQAIPERPDVIFEDCSMISPQCGLKGGNFGFHTYMRVKLERCKLIALNFSQPQGTPIDGVIQSVESGKYLHVDLKDTDVMGYKVFGARVNKETAGELGYTTAGACRAYVQYQQDCPAGFARLAQWPIDVFEYVAPPPPDAAPDWRPTRDAASVQSAAPAHSPAMVKLPWAINEDAMEVTPVIFKGRPLLMMSRRSGGSNVDLEHTYLYIRDLITGSEISRFASAHSFGCAFVNGDELNVFAAEYSADDWSKDIFRFSTTDLKEWKREPAIMRQGDEHLFNSSVCRDEQGFLMAYESNKPVQFCFRFARSSDLKEWKTIENTCFTGENSEYSACPCLRYIKPYYYVIYLHTAVGGRQGWEAFLARSKDLSEWELSPLNPILIASAGEGTNNSDVDMFELEGKTYLYYSTGDQATWGAIRCAMFPGTMEQFFAAYFPEGVAGKKAVAGRGP